MYGNCVQAEGQRLLTFLKEDRWVSIILSILLWAHNLTATTNARLANSRVAFRNKEEFMTLYIAYIRSILDYAECKAAKKCKCLQHYLSSFLILIGQAHKVNSFRCPGCCSRDTRPQMH